MQKWEYCAVAGIKRDLRKFRGISPEIWKFTINGIEETDIGENFKYVNEASAETAKIIAQLGQQGWEMVGIGYSNHYDENILYFKRPIET